MLTVKVMISVEAFDKDRSISAPSTFETEIATSEDFVMELFDWKAICAGLVDRALKAFWRDLPERYPHTTVVGYKAGSISAT